ncbi:MAG: exo-alpha-sialidase [Verrucomicrobia bacterium]|nr:exo-alpha-sialidase [Verrucomicrobiota bacterium]
MQLIPTLRRLAALLVLFAGGLDSCAFARPAPPAEVLLRAGEGSYHTYRIPASVVVRNGVIVLLLEGRKDAQDDFAAIDLLCLRSLDGGRTWSRPQVVYTEGAMSARISIGNPCPVYDAETGRLWCGFTKDNQQVYVTYSDDAGATWARPREITRDVRPFQWTRYWTGPGHGLQLRQGSKKGRLILPSYHMLLEARDGGHSTVFAMRSHMVYSDDHGQTWKIGASTQLSPELDTPESRFSGKWIPGESTWHGCEGMAEELTDGRVYLTIRNQVGTGGAKAEAFSSDGGETWTPVKLQPQLPDPRCQAGLVRWTEPGRPGKALFVYTGITTDTRAAIQRFQPIEGLAGRQRLAAYVSSDDCRTWREAGVVFAGASAYSDLVVLPDGNILCFFEGGEKAPYESIRMARLGSDWLGGKRPSD